MLLGEFHHLGWVCRNIDQESVVLALAGYKAEGPVFEDPIQKVYGQFMIGGGPRVELLCPMEKDSPLSDYLKRGIKVYHHAYEVKGVDKVVEHLIVQGCKVAVKPTPAVAFNMRRITFLVMRNLYLLELIEK